MKNIFLTTALLLGSQAPILANSPTPILRYAGVQESNLNNLVTQLEQNAIMIMMGMVILIGLCLIGYVCSACVKLNKTQRPSPRNIIGILFFVAGMSLISSSCSVEQQLRAADIRAAKQVEGGHCVCLNARNNQPHYGQAGLNTQFPYYQNYNGATRPFCKQCGHWKYTR